MTEKTTEKKTSQKKIVLGVSCLVALIAVLAIIYSVFGPKTLAGGKEITIEVVNKAQESTVYEVATEAKYLRQAMEEAEGLTFDGTDGMVDTINGETADYNADGAYWSFYINDEYCNNGIDTQPVADGDAFKIIYTTAVTQ